MKILSPTEQHMISGGVSICRCSEHGASTTDMPLPLISAIENGRIFADTVTAREMWPM